MQYFFVTGSPKSGTTWLQMLLDAHPDVVCSGEGAFFERLIQPITDVRAKYNDYMSYANKAVYEGNGFYDGIPFPEIKEQLRQIVFNLMSKRAAANTLAIGDKTPRHNLFLNSMHMIFPEAKYINIVRHPCDVAVSKLFHGARVGQTDALDPASKLRTRLIEQTARDWNNAQQRVQDFRLKHPGLLVDVRYEDLIEAPVREASRLFRHIGVSDDETIAQAAVDMARFEKLSGGRAQGTQDVKSFFRKGVAGDWKTELEPAMARLICEACQPLMLHYGYEGLDQTGRPAAATP